MTEIVITGTGNPLPAPGRAGPGVLVRHGDVAMQFDAGRGTVLRLTEAGQHVGRLSAVFATHHHSDHLTGLQDLVLTRWVIDRRDQAPPLPIIVPDGPCVGFVERMLDPWSDDLAVRRHHTRRDTEPAFELHAFEVASEPAEVWRRDDLVVIAGPVRHEPVRPAVGYRIETPDGVVVITGDTRVCDEVATLAAGADVLIYEAMRFVLIEGAPPEFRFVLDYHADTRLIGAQAAELGVPTLVLTHLIPAPRDDAERAGFEADVRDAGFTGEIIVADDLDAVHLG